ncbi:hypothetical protein, partial [Klebsiella pneumoniae]|uniref:hypothetical protein n=1 Tax=Klebsiella pneumoniae TaxID=573 RepID=UPI003F74DE64
FVLAMLMLALTAVFFLMRDYPADVGLPRYGETATTEIPARQHGLATLMLSPLIALRDAARTYTFWV